MKRENKLSEKEAQMYVDFCNSDYSSERINSEWIKYWKEKDIYNMEKNYYRIGGGIDNMGQPSISAGVGVRLYKK
jgi:hypothetical protein